MADTILRIQYFNNSSPIDLDAHLDLDGDGTRDLDELIEAIGGSDGNGFFKDAADGLLTNPYTGTDLPNLVDISVKGRQISGGSSNLPGQIRSSSRFVFPNAPVGLTVDTGNTAGEDEGKGTRDFNNGEIIRFDLQGGLSASAATVTFIYNFQDLDKT
jgi:hypothetical protein